MSIELEPPIPTAEELQRYADRERESLAIFRLYGPAYYEDVYRLNQWMLEMIFAQARKEPWARPAPIAESG